MARFTPRSPDDGTGNRVMGCAVDTAILAGFAVFAGVKTGGPLRTRAGKTCGCSCGCGCGCGGSDASRFLALFSGLLAFTAGFEEAGPGFAVTRTDLTGAGWSGAAAGLRTGTRLIGRSRLVARGWGLAFAAPASPADLFSLFLLGAGLSVARAGWVGCACLGVGFEGRLGADVVNDESLKTGAAGRDGSDIEVSESKRSLRGEALRGVGFCGRGGSESLDDCDMDSEARDSGVPSRDCDAELAWRVRCELELCSDSERRMTKSAGSTLPTSWFQSAISPDWSADRCPDFDLSSDMDASIRKDCSCSATSSAAWALVRIRPPAPILMTVRLAFGLLEDPEECDAFDDDDDARFAMRFTDAGASPTRGSGVDASDNTCDSSWRNLGLAALPTVGADMGEAGESAASTDSVLALKSGLPGDAMRRFLRVETQGGSTNLFSGVDC